MGYIVMQMVSLYDSGRDLQRCDLVIATFPFTDLTSSKRRPALVLALNSHPDDVIMAFISSVVPAQPSPYDLVLSSSDANFAQSDLKVASVARLNKLATVERRLLTRRIGSLTVHQMQLIDQKLAQALGISLRYFYQHAYDRLRHILNTQGIEALLDELS